MMRCETTPILHAPDPSTIQDIDAMRALPHDEYLEASKGMRAALAGHKGHDVKAICIEGRLWCLRRVGSWWYAPHAVFGWRCPDRMTTSNL